MPLLARRPGFGIFKVISVVFDDRKSQKAASVKVDFLNQSLLLNQLQEGNARDLARLSSLGLKYAGSWLSAVPSPALGLHLRPAEFVPIVRYRLGINVYSSTPARVTAPLVVSTVTRRGIMHSPV